MYSALLSVIHFLIFEHDEYAASDNSDAVLLRAQYGECFNNTLLPFKIHDKVVKY